MYDVMMNDDLVKLKLWALGAGVAGSIPGSFNLRNYFLDLFRSG